jgi:hypothetical protein
MRFPSRVLSAYARVLQMPSPFSPPPVFAAYFAEATKVKKAKKTTTGRPVRSPVLATDFTPKAIS